MPKIRYLKVRFANEIHPTEVPYFRAAVIEATERQSSLFHNHTPDSGVIYRYPLIQYKLTQRKASVICIEQGTDDIHFLFQQRELLLRIGDRTEPFAIEDIHLQYFNVQLWDHRFRYYLRDWQALNQENYKRYAALESEVERLQLLERALTGHLLSLAKGIDWQVDAPITVAITRRHDERWLSYKGQKTLCFNLDFTTNMSLPDGIGLGMGGSLGFGVVFGRHEPTPANDQRSQQIGAML